MLILIGVVVLLGASQNNSFYVEGLGCVGLKCENGGTVMVDSSGDSYCACPSEVTGLLCEYRIRESAFPSGPYAIPMSKDGCPEGPGYGWRKGNINITTRLSLYDPASFSEECREFVHDLRSILKPSNDSFRTDILGPFDRYTFQLNFCFKLPIHRYGNKTSWPRGNYGIYGSHEGCPTGLSANEFSMCLPPVLHYQIDGHVPTFDLIERKNGSEMKFLYCRHQENVEDVQVDDFDSFYPFTVIKDPGSSTDGCPEPVGYVSTADTFPVPLPTSIRYFNTTTSKMSVPNEYFQISYCHIIPSHFQQADSLENNGYTELFLRNEFPAYLYPFVDITTGKYRCGSIGPQLPGCDTANTWILVDIRRAVLVSAVLILSRKENLDVAVSDIFVSDQRWSFLYNGALLCRNKETETPIIGMRAFRCIKPQLGRYVTLTVSPLENGSGTIDFSGTTVSVLMYNAAQVYETEKRYRDHEIEHLRNLSLVSAEIASVIDHTDIESKRCHQELGMQGFGISQDQLTASSWQPQNLPSQARPGYSGWCADSFDKSPYIQVDLVFKTLIDGIVIINWGELVDTYHGNVYGREIVARGAASLHVMYGYDTQNMSRTRDLIYDNSRKLGTPHTFLFSDPFLARYLRMYPRAFPGANSACLKFEILGCRFFDLVNVRCLDESLEQITESDQTNPPHSEMTGMYHNQTSWECEELCLQNVTNCRSAFYPGNGSCYVYMIDETDNYPANSSQEERDSLSVMCCLQDKESRSDTFRFHNGWAKYQQSYVVEPGILASVGYPYTYPYNSIYSWKIDLPEKFATLQFMDISLRKFKWKGRNGFLECTDAIYIYRMKDGTILNPFQELGTLYSSKVYTVNSDFNGRTPVFSMESPDRLESNFIIFYSCSYGDVFRTGRGFRVHVSGTDQPFCHSEEEYTYCMLPEMELISRRFLGRPGSFLQWRDTVIPYFWLIGYIYSMNVDGQLSLVTLVELKDFDISCYSESYFAITVMDKITNVYCNANRPFGKLTTLTRYMYVHYTPRQLQPAVDTVFPEGFRLAYKAIPIDKSFQELVTERNGNEDNSTKQVCMREFGKCYSIHTVFSLSWIGVARMCQEKNASIVNIKTAKEMNLLRKILLEHYQFNRSPPLELHIGLMRYKDSTGVTHDHWTDGAPLAYTAWDQGEPSNTIINKCTTMRIHQPEKNNTWRTCSCLANYEPDSALAAVCETRTKSSEISYTALPFDTNFEKDYIFEARDISTIHECGSGERVSSLARCNGVSECQDASDETMCELHDKDRCTEEEFRCTDGRCIHISKVCDFKKDCMDASDEYCEFPRCTTDQFSCSNQQCIPSEERCDSVKQCYDGSDEQDCEQCHSNKAFQCGDKSCIHERLVCDMHVDCPDGADESSCNHEYKTCDELWRDGYKTNGFFKTGQGYSIYCNFDNLDKGWGTLEMTYPNNDWRQLGENSFRIQTQGIENALENGYSRCTQKFSAVPQRDKVRVLNLDNKTVTSFEEELPLQGFPTFIISRVFEVSREDTVFSITLLGNFDIFENRIKISGVKCRKYIPKDAGLKEPVLFCRDNVRPALESRHCLYSRDESGIIEGCRSLEHLQHCESFICPESYVKCPNSYCIPSMYVCNGKADCPDGHDERVCACKNSNMKLIILMPTHLTETNEQAYKWRRISAQLAGIMYSKGSDVKIIRTVNTRSISRNETDKDEYFFESTDIVANSHHMPLDQMTSQLTAKNIEDFFLGITSHENGKNDTGIIFLSDKKIESEEERVIFSGIDSLNRNIKTFRVIIDKYSTKDVFVTNKEFSKEIHVRNDNVLGTIGTQLFPEICNESRPVCSKGYRCLYSKVCIPLKQVCDKAPQCPYGDDEQFCDFKCPRNCSCAPSIINCSNINNEIWESNIIRDLSPRVLNIANSTSFCQHILSNEETRQSLSLLISLNMSKCNIGILLKSSFTFLQNLIKLDISFNRFSVLKKDVFFHLKALQLLELSGNYYLTNIEPGTFSGIKIKSLTIKYTKLKTLSANTFTGLVLDNLDLSNNMISSIQDLSFNSLTCSAIDISGNPITTFTKSIFTGGKGIESLRTPAYKFCCARPSYLNEDDCLPHKDEFSSCKDLLRNSTLQALMWIIGVLALIGNIISLVYRLLYDKKRLKLGYGIFATNLALADLLMGVYMMIIAIADNIFRDKYIEMDDFWRNSAWCRLAGVLSTLSSEASVLFMCLITVDRILVIKYPFGQFRITTKTAVISVLMCWVFVFFVSLFPIVYSGYFQGQFYSKSAVCLALPLTRDRPPGWLYSILIFIGFNMLTFILIAVGQLLIYIEVKKHARFQKFLNKTRSNDLRVARNLLLVVTTDFLCWFPVGVMGLLALAGKTVPGAVYAWTAVIVLPINSAINPFMYTLTAIYGRQKFNPSIDEQSRTDITKETGKAMLKLYPYVPTHKQRKNSKLISLADLMVDRRLTALDTIVLIYRILGFLDVLHHHDLVVGNITEQEVYVLVSGNRKILGKVQIDLKSHPELSSKTNDKADDVNSCGCLLRRMLQTESLS